MDSYWNKVLMRRISRRRAMVAGGGFTAAAAFLAACGGDDDEQSGGTSGSSSSGGGATGGSTPAASGGGSSGSASSGLLTEPINETSSAKKGGVLKSRNSFEPSTLDPQQFPNNFHSNATYSNLFRIEDGVLSYSTGNVIGDLVESWELSGDKLTITAKLNPDAHFAPTAPVNGRAVDANDVVASWQRHSESSNQRFDFANSANPAAPIKSIEASDERTIIISLAAPNAVVTARLARATPGSMYVVPKEALDPAVLDLNRTSIGSGPYYMSEYEPSTRIVLTRNPGFHDEDFPLIETIEYPTVPEYAAFLAQYKAGNIYEGGGLLAEDLLPAKKDNSEMELMATYFSTLVPRIGFGMAEGSPFVDDRLRQAWVLGMDRELFLTTVFNKDRFADAGLDVVLAYESGLQANTFAGWLIDPLSAEFGENSKFFTQDVAEAKKLIVAAGHEDGVLKDFDLTYASAGAGVPGTYSVYIDTIIALMQESGLFEWNLNIIQNFFAEFIPVYHNQARGTFSGVSISLSSLAEDPANYLFTYYNSFGTLRMGTDETLSEMTANAIQEFDAEARKEICHEIQRYEGGKNFYPRLGGGSGFSIAWPAVRNREVYQGGSGRSGTLNSSTLWIDPAKAPLA
ncbi:MAG TPA: ABC transporter substrate-binding protein [Dehalococcoidia bacterium]|nr:ABC transporter substrate-binding protein [Dehalococcoidia bacterium]